MRLSTCQQNLSVRHNSICGLIFPFCLVLLLCLCPEPLSLAKAQSSNLNSKADFVTQEVRYHVPGAGEVWLLWGVNGWQSPPDAFRPPGTSLSQDKLIHTPLVRKGKIFTATVRVPPGTTIDHGFLITKTEGGAAVNIWETGPSAKVRNDGRIEVEATATMASPEQYSAWLGGKQSDIPLVTQQLQYHAPGAGEVWLLWGVNGWQPVPDTVRPLGTILYPDKVMHTPLVRKGEIFTTTVRVPPGTTIDHGFVITKTEGGTAVDIWETDRPYTRLTNDSRIEFASEATAVTVQQRKAWLDGQAVELPLVKQEIRCHATGTDKVSLAWGLDGWQAIPVTARPPGTAMKDGIMQTFMAREGNLFTATLQVPAGAILNYKFVMDNKKESSSSSGKSDSNRAGGIMARHDGLIDIHSAVTKATMEQRKTWPRGRLVDLSLVAQEIRYRIAGAEDVWLVWGINQWQTIPEEARPAGTVLKDKVMHSPMVRSGDTFTATVRIPPGTMLEYKFFIAKTSRGAPVSIWQDHGGTDFWKLIRVSGSLEEKATVTVVTAEQRKAWVAGQTADLPLVTQEIRYRAPGAAEVWLVWGLEAWQAIPEAARPPGTVVKNGLLHTRMVREGTRFTTTVRLPPGTGLDFSFLITKTEDGKIVDVRQEKDEEGRAFTKAVLFDGQIDVQSTAWLSLEAADHQTLTQEIRYRIAGAEEVWLVWGINGWQPIPDEARPPGTVLKDNKVMHSRMVRKGDVFATTVRVPPRTLLDYKFLITKTSRGTPVSIWQDNDGQAFQRKLARVSGSLEEKATVTVVTAKQRKAWLAGQAADLPLVSQEIRYRARGAGEVWLVWGVEGWQEIPEASRPRGTVLRQGKMQTPMLHEGQTFIAQVQVPPGTEFNFWFLITKTQEGKVVDIRQDKDGEGRTLSRVVAFDGRIEVQSTTSVLTVYNLVP